jgi:YHS domain-containing protein
MVWFWVVIIAAVGVVVAYWLSPASAVRLRRGPFKSGATERDPVCGMDVDVSHASGHREQGGRVYWFCSTACTNKFDANPDYYSKNADAPPPVHAQGASH